MGWFCRWNMHKCSYDTKTFPKFLQWKLDLYLQIIYIRIESVSQSWEQWGTAGMVKAFKVMVKRQCMEKQMF